MSVAEDGWKRVVFTFEFGEDGLCPVCNQEHGECECPGPNSEHEDGTPYQFKEVDGVLYAKP